MFPKHTLIGIIIAKGIPQIKVVRSKTSKMGYTVLPNIVIRSNAEFLGDIKKSLLQHHIKSKLRDKENVNRPSPILVIGGESMRVLTSMIPATYSTNGDWEQFKTVLLMMRTKQHLTLEGLEKIMEMKGLL